MFSPALFLVPYPIDTRYAIESYIRMFLRAATRLNDGDRERVHFAFTSTRGTSRALPDGFPNVVEFDAAAGSQSSRDAFARYIRDNKISFVMLLDVQPVAPIVRFLRETGVDVVISYWGAPISDPFTGPRLWMKRAGVRIAGRNRVDSLVFESQAMARLAVTGRGCPASMLDVVPLGIDPAQIPRTAQPGYLQRELGIPADKTVVLFCGHTHERKGVGTLLDAAAILRFELRRDDLFFLLCGNRGDEAEPWLRRIRGTAAEDCVMFGGYRSDMPAVMRAAHIGVIPSSGWDSFTVSSLELAAAGLPVIVSRLGGLPEAIVEGETGLVFEPGNARDLAGCIVRLADSPEERLLFGQRGNTRVQREFTLELQEARLADVFARRIAARWRSWLPQGREEPSVGEVRRPRAGGEGATA